MRLGLQTHFGAKSQSEGTIQLVPKLRKMATIVPRRRRGTWEGVPVANWCSEWICRMRGGLGPHILIIPASLSLLPMRGAAISRAPTILQKDSFYTRISNFVQSPILLATRCVCWPMTKLGGKNEIFNMYVSFIGLRLTKTSLTLINRTRLWTKGESAGYPQAQIGITSHSFQRRAS